MFWVVIMEFLTVRANQFQNQFDDQSIDSGNRWSMLLLFTFFFSPAVLASKTLFGQVFVGSLFLFLWYLPLSSRTLGHTPTQHTPLTLFFQWVEWVRHGTNGESFVPSFWNFDWKFWLLGRIVNILEYSKQEIEQNSVLACEHWNSRGFYRIFSENLKFR